MKLPATDDAIIKIALKNTTAKIPKIKAIITFDKYRVNFLFYKHYLSRITFDLIKKCRI